MTHVASKTVGAGGYSADVGFARTMDQRDPLRGLPCAVPYSDGGGDTGGAGGAAAGAAG